MGFNSAFKWLNPHQSCSFSTGCWMGSELWAVLERCSVTADTAIAVDSRLQ